MQMSWSSAGLNKDISEFFLMILRVFISGYFELCSHFDLSSLISMARMQSAQRKKVKRLMRRRGIEPGSLDFTPSALPLRYRHA